mgnify:CR=1 FL=1
MLGPAEDAAGAPEEEVSGGEGKQRQAEPNVLVQALCHGEPPVLRPATDASAPPRALNVTGACSKDKGVGGVRGEGVGTPMREGRGGWGGVGRVVRRRQG